MISDTVDFASSSMITSFNEFVQNHGRTYQPGSVEYEQRRALFEERLIEITEHNSKLDRGWTATINKLADRTTDELKRLRGWDNRAARTRGPSIGLSQSFSNGTDDDTWIVDDAIASVTKSKSRAHGKSKSPLPACVSWKYLDAMQAKNIQNQAACGSCWAFAAAKALQAHSEIYHDKRTFSVEQIVSCTKNPRHCGGDGGCQGATSEMAFEYVLGVGAETDTSIPYIGRDEICKTEKYQDNGPYSSSLLLDDGRELHSIHDAKAAKLGGGALGMTGWLKNKENSLDSLKGALVQHGPVAVSVSAAYGWNSYSSGILTEDACPKDAIIDHAVTLVGYGKDGSHKYWHILNSWGADWGEGGFIRISMSDNDGDYCGTDDKPEEGTACEGETEPVRVCGMCGILYDTSVPLFAGDGAAAKKKAVEECS